MSFVRGVRAYQQMELIDEQDAIAGVLSFLENLVQSFLELSPVVCASLQ